MANWNVMTDATMDRIVKLSAVFKANEIAEMLGVSYPSATKVLRADRLAAAGDVETLKTVQSDNIIKWAANKYGVDISPAEEEKPEPVEEAPAAPAVNDNTATCMVKLLETMERICATLDEMRGSLSRINGRLVNIENASANSIDRVCLNENFNLLFSELKEAKNAPVS